MILDDLITLYDQFLSFFPVQLHLIISLIIFIVIVMAVIDLVKRNFIWLILLIILIPASIPVLRNIFNGLVVFLQHIL